MFFLELSEPACLCGERRLRWTRLTWETQERASNGCGYPSEQVLYASEVVPMRPKQNQTSGGSTVMLLFLWGWFRLEKGIRSVRTWMYVWWRALV